MKTWQGTFSGFLGIATLVGFGVLHANDPGMQHWPLSAFNPGDTTNTQRPHVVVNRVDWSSDGRLLLSLSRGGLNAQGGLTIHDATRQAESMPIDLMGVDPGAVAFAPDGRHVLVGSWKGGLSWLTVDGSYDPTLLVELPRESMFTAVAVAGDGRQLAAGTQAGTIYLCNPERQFFNPLTCACPSAVVKLGFSRDAKQLVVSQCDGRVCVWDVKTRKLLQEFLGHDQRSRAEFLSDGRIISAGQDDTVRIWEIASGRELWRGEFGLFGVNALAVSTDGTTAAWGGLNHKIIVWDLERGRKMLDISTPTSVLDLNISPDGSLLASTGMDRTIRLYDAATGVEHPAIDVAGWQLVQDGK